MFDQYSQVWKNGTNRTPTVRFKSITRKVEVFLRKAWAFLKLGCLRLPFFPGKWASSTASLLFCRSSLLWSEAGKEAEGLYPQRKKTNIYRPEKVRAGISVEGSVSSCRSEGKMCLLLEKGQKYVSSLEQSHNVLRDALRKCDRSPKGTCSSESFSTVLYSNYLCKIIPFFSIWWIWWCSSHVEHLGAYKRRTINHCFPALSDDVCEAFRHTKCTKSGGRRCRLKPCPLDLSTDTYVNWKVSAGYAEAAEVPPKAEQCCDGKKERKKNAFLHF